MPNVALDLTGISCAVNTRQWAPRAVTNPQRDFLRAHTEYSNALHNFASARGMASINPVALNEFMSGGAKSQRGWFSNSDGTVGVATKFDFSIEWAASPGLTVIECWDPTAGVFSPYPAFSVGPSTATLHEVQGFVDPLFCVVLPDGHRLWLIRHNELTTDLDAVRAARRILISPRSRGLNFTVRIPMFQVAVEKSFDWLHGMQLIDLKGHSHEVTQTLQQFSISATQKARIPYIPNRRSQYPGYHEESRCYNLDRTFLGFVTPYTAEGFVTAAFWFDIGSWCSSGTILTPVSA